MFLAGRQLAAKRAAALHVERLVNGLVADPHCPVLGKVYRQAPRDLLRTPRLGPSPCLARPFRRPFQGTSGPGTTAPPGAPTLPASRSCTYVRSAALPASFADFERRAARSACHCAVVARYSRPPPRVAALRRSSRETVDPDRPSRRPISRTPQPCACRIASSSRFTNDRYRPRAASTMTQASMVACRPPPGTTAPQPPATPPRPPQRPRSTNPPQSPSRTAADHRGAQSQDVLATATAHAQTDPTFASSRTSQLPPHGCCDDQLNLTNTCRFDTPNGSPKPASSRPWAASATAMTMRSRRRSTASSRPR